MNLRSPAGQTVGSGAFRAGDTVVVRSPEDIRSTLDTDGTLDGLPFMPEMLEWCGKVLRVQRRVEKTCVDVEWPEYPNRRFAANDVVMLEGLRCAGQHHDGCKRACRIFWKEAWLRRADAGETSEAIAEPRLAALRSHLRVRADEHRYFCQSTELRRATEEFLGRKKPWMLRVMWREVRNRDRSAWEIVGGVSRWCSLRLRRLGAGERWLRGPHTSTPVGTLSLEPGDIVRIRSREQIVATLDQKSRNRGLRICGEMTRCCGGTAEVRTRVDRIIDERTGKMRELQHAVTLQNLHGQPSLCDECLCHNEIGDCPRGELMFWREIWLDRA